jgi:hypothetical protein
MNEECAIRGDHLEFSQRRAYPDDDLNHIQVVLAGETMRRLSMNHINDISSQWRIDAPLGPHPEFPRTVFELCIEHLPTSALL